MSEERQLTWWDDGAEESPRLGLVVRRPWVDLIVDGVKTWELRGSATRIRGAIALIEAGTGTIVGTARLVGVEGPLTPAEYRAAGALLGNVGVEEGDLPYAQTYAWVLRGARRLPSPVPYDHPSGAVIWVRLSDAVRERLHSSTDSIV